MLVRLADGSHETEFASAVRYALQGGVRDVPAESIQRVLEALTDSEKRLVLLRAQAHGVLEAGGSGRKLLDVEQHLLEDPLLSPSERGSILVKRAIRALRQGKLQAAREGLLVARALDLDASTSEQLQKTLRGVLLRIGDDSAIREELLESPLPEDSFAYARRGADALLTRGRLAATRWYGEALKYARTGDEKTAALQGLQACDDPADWTRGSALDEERMAILPEERPRTERVYDLQSAAGRKLLAMYRVGRQKASHEPDQAIEKLREALEEADDMGWPKSVRANLTTAADGLALEIVGLLLANEPTSDQVQQALAFSIERGLLGIERHFDGTVFDRLVSEPSAVTATRALLQVRDEAPFMKRSRALLRSALLPLLPDEQISTHIEACIDIVELNSGTFFEKSSTESHLELLAKHYESFPPAGAAYMLGIFSGVLRSDENRSSLRATWLRVPICDWVRTGVVKPADPALRECVSALLTVFARGLVANDPFVGRVAFSWLEQFVEAGVLLEAERQDFVRWLDSELADSSTRSEIDRTRVFELAHARAQLGSWTPPPEVRAVFMNGYAKLKNSTAVGRWLTLVGTFAVTLSTEEKAAVVRDVFDYADRTLSQQNSTFGPFPEWAAEAISQAATSGILPTPDALKKLQELGRMYPEVLALAVDLPGIDVEAAEQNLLAAVAVESEDVSLLRWCQDLPPNRVSLRLERIALGGLHARDGRSRQLAYWSCAALAKNGNLSASGRIVLAEAISKFGVLDRDWHVRGAAVAATARILDCIEKQGMLQVLAVAAADPIARVRRSAGFLQLAISASEAAT